MKPLPEALASIAAGWSPRCEIADRAAVMATHARAGNVRRAEEYAVEIEALQSALAAKEASPFAMTEPPVWAVSQWQLGHEAWARILVHGWRCGRRVYAAEGWTSANVAAEARRIFPMQQFTAADVVAPAMRIAA